MCVPPSWNAVMAIMPFNQRGHSYVTAAFTDHLLLASMVEAQLTFKSVLVRPYQLIRGMIEEPLPLLSLCLLARNRFVSLLLPLCLTDVFLPCSTQGASSHSVCSKTMPGQIRGLKLPVSFGARKTSKMVCNYSHC